jgi:hypothetical protein
MAEESKIDSEAEDTKQVPPISKLLRSILKDVFPMRSTFTFRNKIIVSSDFDSGNLSYCELAPNSEIIEESKAESSSIF